MIRKEVNERSRKRTSTTNVMTKKHFITESIILEEKEEKREKMFQTKNKMKKNG